MAFQMDAFQPDTRELLARMKRFEDNFAERKPLGDRKDWLKTAVAFANSTPEGKYAVAGASDARFKATPLTQARRRVAKGTLTVSASKPAPSPPTICQQCGKPIKRGTESCSTCSKVNSRDSLLKAAQRGRIAAQQPEVLARLGEKQRSHRLAELAWKAEDKPAWLDEVVYATQVHPRLANFSISRIAMTLGVSSPYASDIRAGRNRPHPRHWLALAQLAGVLGERRL